MRDMFLELFILLTLTTAAPLPAFAKPKEIKIAVFDFCPWQCPSLNDPKKPGIAIEIAQLIFEKAGYQIQFLPVPYARAIHGTEDADYDMILNINALTSKKLLLSAESSAYMEMNFYVRKDSTWHYTGVGSLKNIQIISILGYNYTPISPAYQRYISENENSGKVIFVSGDDASERAFRMIIERRATTFNEDASVFAYVTRKGGIHSELKKGETLGGGPLYAGFPLSTRSARTFRDVFDKGIARLRNDGALQAIFTRYGVSDWMGNKVTIKSKWDL